MNGNKAISLGAPQRISDQIIRYEALGQATQCRLRLFRFGRAYLVLLSDDPANDGPSLHNTIEDALAYTRQQWELLPKNIAVIEQRSGPTEDTFARVSVRWTDRDGRIVVHHPRWSATTRAQVEQVVGGPV